MSDTKERYTKIEAPLVDSSKYGDDLKDQFDNINNNFERLSVSEFLRGFAGDSVECFVVSMSDIINNSNKYQDDNNKHIIANKIKSYFAQLPINLIVDNKYNPKIGISDIIIIGDKQILNTIGNINQNSLNNIYILPMYFFDSNETLSFENIKDYISYTGVYTYKLDFDATIEYDIKVTPTQHTISIGAYYDDMQRCICWKIDNCKTGTPIQGTPGKDGSNGKILIGTYQKLENDYARDITFINSANSGDLKQYPCILTEYNGYKTYIAILEDDTETGEYKAQIKSTQDITKLFDKNGLIIPFASNTNDFSKAFTITAKEDDENHILSFSSNVDDKNDTKTKQIAFNNVAVVADSVWSAKLTVGNENSKDTNTATIYKGLKLISATEDANKKITTSENTLTADTDGFYVGKKNKDNKVVVTSELDKAKTDITNGFKATLEDYYKKGDDDNELIKLITNNTTTIKEQGQNTIINGTVIDKGTYNSNNFSKEDHHLYFIYENKTQ